jgi:hypothetical protein
MMAGVRKPPQVVILSGEAASHYEAATQSKDPYEVPGWCCPGRFSKFLHAPAAVEMLGVLRLRQSIRKRMGWLRSG